MPVRLGWVWVVLLVSAGAQPKKFELTIDNIMRGPGLYGYVPQAVRWSGDSQKVFFQWKKHDEPVGKRPAGWVVNRDGSGLRKLTEDEEREAPPVGGDQTRDWKLAVFAREGDIWLYDLMALKPRRLTRTGEVESEPRFTADENRITYVRSNNLFVVTPADGSTEQLTDIRPPGSPRTDGEQKGSDSQEYLKKEEKSLLEIVRERAERREEEEARRKKLNPRKPFRLGARQSVTSLQLSGDESFVMAWISESAEKRKTTEVPNYVTESGYTAEISSRPKVGDDLPRTRVALLDVKTGDSRWVEHGLTEPDKDGKTKPRDVQLLRSLWSRDGSKTAVLVRSMDNKDHWITALDPKSGRLRVLVHMHDDAWVNFSFARVGWLDNRQLYYLGERDGWSHLYTVDFETGDSKQLTSGKWEVRDVKLTQGRKEFLLTTSEVHAGEEHVFAMSVDGGIRRRLTHMPGGHDAEPSPDGTLLASVYSYTNRPPELYLLPVKDAAKPLKVTESPAPDFSQYSWLDVPIVEIPARDGVKVPARLYKPANWRKGGPLVVFVHGAGYLQNVHRRWSSYAREYMFHHLLMERGYLVLDVDYRASAGYGRDWRTAIYRHMGGKDLDDQVDAVKWAIAQHGVDPRRVGVYGGSYGGFITLMALFTQPEVFAAGAALRPVTDWAHYNQGYTSNILNIPQKDEEAYRRSSPIYHAQGLKGALLICHGMVDINVHFQDTVRLVQRLIELRKENWELAVYPVEDHGFQQPTSWADEYRRIFKLFESTIGRPAAAR